MDLEQRICRVSCWSVGYRVVAATAVRRDRVVDRMPVVADLRIVICQIHIAMQPSAQCQLLHRAAEVSSHGAQWVRELEVLPGCRQRLVRTVGQLQLEQRLEVILESRVRCLGAASVKCEWC